MNSLTGGETVYLLRGKFWVKMLDLLVTSPFLGKAAEGWGGAFV